MGLGWQAGFGGGWVAAVALALGGCGAIPAGLGGSGGNGSGGRPATAVHTVSPDTPLRPVIVPGSVRSIDTPASQRMDPLLDANTPVPAFAEADALRQHCQPGQQADPRDAQGQPLADAAGFDARMREGLAIAQARHAWQFHQQRLQRQRAVAEGFAARIEPARLERMRGELQLQQQWLREVDAARAAGRTSPQDQRALQQRAPKVMITAAHRVPQALDDLRHNAAVLQAQDARLQAQETAYLDGLIALYAQAFERLAAQPLARLPLATVTQFERYRAFNIQACSERGRLSAAARERGDALRQRYEPLLASGVAATQAEALAAMDRATGSAQLGERMAELYPTPLMQQAANAVPALASRYQARRDQLLAQEARAREAERRRAQAAEAARLAALKREYRERAARNTPPTLDEVAKLVTTYTMENTQAKGELGALVRSSDTSFADSGRFNFFGTIVSTNAVSVSDLSCKATGPNALQCQFDGGLHFTDMQGGLALRSYAGTTERYDVPMHWTDDGLASAELKRKVGVVGYPAAPASGSASAKDPWDRYWARQEWRREEQQRFYLRQRTDPDFRRATGGY